MTRREVQNQGEIAVYGPEDVKPSQTSKDMKLSVNAGQTWRIQTLDIETHPLATIALKYKEETTGNELSIGTFYQYELPLIWKPTASDNHLVIWEQRDLLFQVTNPTGGDITVRAKVQYIKVYLGRKGGS